MVSFPPKFLSGFPFSIKYPAKIAVVPNATGGGLSECLAFVIPLVLVPPNFLLHRLAAFLGALFHWRNWLWFQSAHASQSDSIGGGDCGIHLESPRPLKNDHIIEGSWRL